jgi:hypothetical protein
LRRFSENYRSAFSANSSSGLHFDELAISLPQLDTATKSAVGYARKTAIKWRSSSSISPGSITV